jgi:hypothetical protein
MSLSLARSAAVLLACGATLAALSGCGSSGGRASASASTSSTATTAQFTPVNESNAAEVADSSANPSAPSAPGQLFSALSPWNEHVAGLPVDPRSSAMLGLADERLTVAESPGTLVLHSQTRTDRSGVYINTAAWTTPVVSSATGVPTKVFCRQLNCGPDSAGLHSLLMPGGTSPDPRFDGWLSVIDSGIGYGYDLWRARRQVDGSISFQYVKRWKLSGPGYSSPHAADAAGARGSGLPLFAGVILASDLQRGVINHALAISVPGPASTNFVAPASTTDGVGPTNSVPEGAHLLLKPSVTLASLPRGDSPRLARMIITALKTYGAIVVDRAGVPTLYAQAGTAPSIVGTELTALRLSDFEVLRLPPLLQQSTAPAPVVTGGGV